MKHRWGFFSAAMLILLVATLAANGSSGPPEKKEPTAGEQTATAKQTAQPSSAATPRPVSGPQQIITVQPASQTEANAPSYAVPWKSINGGGGTAQSGTHKVSLSIGQAAIGHVSGTNYQAGIGFWYGMVGGACNCGTLWGNLNTDGVINAVDVVIIVNYVYKMTDQRTPLPNCPRQPGDANCTAPVNAVDVVLYVNYVYKMMNQFCPDPCGP